jgi:hypothetical protein
LKDNQVDIEQQAKPGQTGSEIREFIKHMRWRRWKSPFEVEIQEDPTLISADAQRDDCRTNEPKEQFGQDNSTSRRA